MTLSRRSFFIATSIFVATSRLYGALKKSRVEFEIKVEDRRNVLNDRASAFHENLTAAAKLWASKLTTASPELTATIRVLAKFDETSGRATTRFPSSCFVKKQGKFEIYDSSACAKLKGKPLEDSSSTDIELTIHTDYLEKLWLDPSPSERTAMIPKDRYDAISLFVHELAHGLGFNGWLDPESGKADKVISTFDQYVVVREQNFYFTGPEAIRVFGGPIPLSKRTNNYHHLGREDMEPKSPFESDVMYGVRFEKGRRFEISPLNLAMMKDCGLPIAE